MFAGRATSKPVSFSLFPLFSQFRFPLFQFLRGANAKRAKAKRPCRRHSAGAFSFAGGGAVAMTVCNERRGSGAPVAAKYFLRSAQFTPAMYRARRPQLVHLSVTCECGCGGACAGSRVICPSQLGQLRGSPVRSAAIRCRACAGLYVFGRGLRITPPRGKSAAFWGVLACA